MKWTLRQWFRRAGEREVLAPAQPDDELDGVPTTLQASESPTPPQATAAPQIPPATLASRHENWFAAVFWLAIVAGIGVIYWIAYVRDSDARMLLNVSTKPERVTGTILFKGRAVTNGVVEITVQDAGTRRYVASATVKPDEKGHFATSATDGALGIDANETAGSAARPLRIAATFTGTLALPSAPDAAIEPLAGEATRYIRAAPPLSRGVLWGTAISFAGLLALQLWVFTGDLGRGKARTLFVLMYFFTFWSLALPLVVSLVVAQNKYLVDSMENSPLGLIRAKTAALAEPQWLINIGGVPKPSPILVNRQDESRILSDAVAAPGAASAPTVVVATAEATAAADEAGITIQGGVTVPFFMVLLAMFGAGINMTLKVPAIQRAYEDLLSSTRGPTWNPMVAPIRIFDAPAPEDQIVPRQTAGDIRRDLIENYMYLLSAPLLAIAVHYLLQVMATQVTQPVLVLMALATGLVSKAVVGGVIDFAEERLLSEKRRGGKVVGAIPSQSQSSLPTPTPKPTADPTPILGAAPKPPTVPSPTRSRQTS